MEKEELEEKLVKFARSSGDITSLKKIATSKTKLYIKKDSCSTGCGTADSYYEPVFDGEIPGINPRLIQDLGEYLIENHAQELSRDEKDKILRNLGKVMEYKEYKELSDDDLGTEWWIHYRR